MNDKKISELPLLEVLSPNAIIPVTQPDPTSHILKTYGAKASQFPSGIGSEQSGSVLLGKLLGANMNLSLSGTLHYHNLTGFPFQIAEIVYGLNGSSGVISQIDQNSQAIILDPKSIKGKSFLTGDTITGNIAKIEYSNISETINVNSIITGDTSRATGNVYSNDGISEMTITVNSGSFQEGETIMADNGATAVVNQYTPPASAIVTSYVFEGIQSITLNGGVKFILNDIVITNASIPVVNSSIALLDTQSGSVIASMDNHSQLLSPSNYIKFGQGLTNGRFNSTVSDSISLIMSTPEGSPATADIYVYGYVIA